MHDVGIYVWLWIIGGPFVALVVDSWLTSPSSGSEFARQSWDTPRT